MPSPQRFDLSRPDQDAAAREAAVAALAGGGLVVVPTETVYGVAARAGDAAAETRLRALKERPAGPFTHAVDDPARLLDRLAPWPPFVHRLTERWWPGPITLIARTRDGTRLGLRVPGHPWTRGLVTALDAPLLLPSANPAGDEAPTSVDAIDPDWLAGVDVVVADGPAPLGRASTVVEPRGLSLAVLREGVVGTADLARHARARVLVVCTGNTCRSPMAERLLRAALARRASDDLLVPEVVSAGTGAAPGGPPSPQAVEALAEHGLDLSDHATRPLAREDVLAADLVLGLARSHLEAVLALAPEAADRLATLDPDGLDVADPFGAPTAEYSAVARRLAAMAEHRARQLAPDPEPVP